MVMDGGWGKEKTREDASPPPPGPLFTAKQRKLKTGSTPLKSPLKSGSLKALVTSGVIGRPPRANQRRMGICHGTPFHILRIRHLPGAMHAAYVAKKMGVVGNMERRFQDWKRHRGSRAAPLRFPLFYGEDAGRLFTIHRKMTQACFDHPHARSPRHAFNMDQGEA